MMLDALRDADQKRPYRAFTLHLADGRTAHVPHPGFMLIPPGNTRAIVLATKSGRIRLIDLLLVVEIEFDEARRRRAS